MSAAEPEGPSSAAGTALPEGAAPADGAQSPATKGQPVFTPKLVLSLVALWAGSSALLYWISKADWWLCALGGLGAVLVIWPGPKAKA